MANKTATDYENDYRTKETANTQNSYNTRKADTEQRKTERTASTQTYITGQNEIIDSATANSVQKVQQQIDAAPGEYQAIFDRNALAEEVGRHAAEVKMANMGMTDSGLSASSQAALSVQRMNADSDARKSMREYVNELENYITDLNVAGESQKKQVALDANYADQLDFQSWDAENDTWYNNRLDEINTEAINYGATRFNADEANRATVEAANITAAAEKEAAQIAASTNNQKDMIKYAQFMMQNMGYSEEAALAAAISMYPTGDATTDAYANNFSAAIKAGYSDVGAAAYANAGGGTAGEIAAAEQELSSAGVKNVSTLTKMYDGTPTAAKVINGITNPAIGIASLLGVGSAITNSATNAWTQSYWNRSVERTMEEAEKNVGSLAVSNNAKQIAVAQAVGSQYKNAVNSKNMGKFIEAMNSQFSGIALQAALSAAGISE